MKTKLSDLPDLESAKFTEPITIKVDPELKKKWEALRKIYRKDNSGWLRQLMRRELENIDAG